MASHLDWREPDWESARSIGILDETSSEVNVKSQPINLSYCLILFLFARTQCSGTQKAKKAAVNCRSLSCQHAVCSLKNSSYCVHKSKVQTCRGPNARYCAIINIIFFSNSTLTDINAGLDHSLRHQRRLQRYLWTRRVACEATINKGPLIILGTQYRGLISGVRPQTSVPPARHSHPSHKKTLIPLASFIECKLSK